MCGLLRSLQRIENSKSVQQTRTHLAVHCIFFQLQCQSVGHYYRHGRVSVSVRANIYRINIKAIFKKMNVVLYLKYLLFDDESLLAPGVTTALHSQLETHLNTHTHCSGDVARTTFAREICVHENILVISPIHNP